MSVVNASAVDVRVSWLICGQPKITSLSYRKSQQKQKKSDIKPKPQALTRHAHTHMQAKHMAHAHTRIAHPIAHVFRCCIDCLLAHI